MLSLSPCSDRSWRETFMLRTTKDAPHTFPVLQMRSSQWPILTRDHLPISDNHREFIRSIIDSFHEIQDQTDDSCVRLLEKQCVFHCRSPRKWTSKGNDRFFVPWMQPSTNERSESLRKDR